MYLCHCKAVTDHAIRDAIRAGATDAIQVGMQCGAGTGCGGCFPALMKLLQEYGLADIERHPRRVQAA